MPGTKFSLVLNLVLLELHFSLGREWSKENRCGQIKGQGCADGRKQQIYKTKEETSSPTVSVEALFLSCIIDAQQQCDVGTRDILGAFMQADTDEEFTHLARRRTCGLTCPS
jgi:hypothetical protein